MNMCLRIFHKVAVLFNWLGSIISLLIFSILSVLHSLHELNKWSLWTIKTVNCLISRTQFQKLSTYEEIVTYLLHSSAAFSLEYSMQNDACVIGSKCCGREPYRNAGNRCRLSKLITENVYIFLSSLNVDYDTSMETNWSFLSLRSLSMGSGEAVQDKTDRMSYARVKIIMHQQTISSKNRTIYIQT